MYFDTCLLSLQRTGTLAAHAILYRHPSINLPRSDINDQLLSHNRLALGESRDVNIFSIHYPKTLWNLNKVFPYFTGERMLHVVRNPLDNLRSCYNAASYSNAIGLYGCPAEGRRTWLGNFFNVLDSYSGCNSIAAGVPLYDQFKDVKCIDFSELLPARIDATGLEMYRWLGLNPGLAKKQSSDRHHTYNDIHLLILREALWLDFDNKHRLPIYITLYDQLPDPSHPAAINASQNFIRLCSIDVSNSRISDILHLDEMCISINTYQLMALPREVQEFFASNYEVLIMEGLSAWAERLFEKDQEARKEQIDELPQVAKDTIKKLISPHLDKFYKRFPHIEALWGLEL
ncbi:hypothetical protein [Aeromonas diversa]|nr:hypothetical protein [Aeromonas diversa]